jgi:hypothetical protein
MEGRALITLRTPRAFRTPYSEFRLQRSRMFVAATGPRLLPQRGSMFCSPRHTCSLPQRGIIFVAN